MNLDQLINRVRSWLAVRTRQYCRECGSEVGMLDEVCQRCGAANRVALSTWTILIMASSVVYVLLTTGRQLERLM